MESCPRDQEAQADELLALRAIYETIEEVPYHELAGCSSLPFSPSTTTFRLPILVIPDLCDETFPPLWLYWSYTPDYPSARPPLFELRATWINPIIHEVALCTIKKELERQYEELGDVVLFTWVEWLKEHILEQVSVNPALYPPAPKRPAEPRPAKVALAPSKSAPLLHIHHGPPLTDRKSKFVAHVAEVHSREDVLQVMKQLLADKKIATATHNISAFRIHRADKTVLEERDDDGETGAGDKLLYLLDRMGVVNTLVVVTRWYGGINLGAARFKHITNVAKQLLLDIGQPTDPLAVLDDLDF